MLYTEKNVRDNIRNRDGKRVFCLGKGDQLTSSARDFLTRERIEILNPEQMKLQRYRTLNGAYLEQKPEHMTHLRGDLSHAYMTTGKTIALTIWAFVYKILCNL